MLLPLPTPAEMAIWDRETIDSIGIPGITLMESASREAVDVLLEEVETVNNKEIFCFAGSGNNGGDAFAMARQLIDLGADVTVFHTKPKKQYRGETRTNLVWAQKLGITLKHITPGDLRYLPQPDIIVDGLLGTGFEGQLRPDYRSFIKAINDMGNKGFIFSIDIPSGLNGLNGTPQPIAVIADATVTFQAPKLGLIMPGASRYTGMLHVRSIGIPTAIQEANSVKHHLVSNDIMSSIPSLIPSMHKGNSGHVLIIGGSEGLTGAPFLAAMGALRSGAGLATIASPSDLADTIKAGSPDIMTLPLATGKQWTPEMAKIILSQSDRFDSFVIGPGLGRERKTLDFLETFVAECPARVVMDADALFALSHTTNNLQALREDTVLTPHPGEMAGLLNTDNKTIQEDRLNAVDSLISQTPATIILKGAGTLVANKNITCICPFTEPNLAVGGSGDVLSGVIASMMAQGIQPTQAACLAVYWHGLAGRLLRKDFPTRGNLASEIADMLPTAAKEHISC